MANQWWKPKMHRKVLSGLCKGMKAHYFIKKAVLYFKKKKCISLYACFWLNFPVFFSVNIHEVWVRKYSILCLIKIPKECHSFGWANTAISHSPKLSYGYNATEKFLSKSLFFISIGSNDIFGYYHSKSPLSKRKISCLL